jgi:hypothetical protein
MIQFSNRASHAQHGTRNALQNVTRRVNVSTSVHCIFKGHSMNNKGTSVFGIYATRTEVKIAVDSLKDAHYDSANISVLFPFTVDAEQKKDRRRPEVPTLRKCSGVADGVLGSVLSIGMLGIPGVGPFLAAGPVVAALSFVGVGSALGGIAGGLTAMGIPDAEAKQYESKIRKNGILLSVHELTQFTNAKAMEILKCTGAENITFTSEAIAAPAESACR